jgi:hypothetical protein
MLDAKPAAQGETGPQAALNGTLPGAGAQLEPFGPCPLDMPHIARRENASAAKSGTGQAREGGEQRHRRAIVLADAWSELDRAREQVRRAKMSGAERAKALREIVTTAADHRPRRARDHRRKRRASSSKSTTRRASHQAATHRGRRPSPSSTRAGHRPSNHGPTYAAGHTAQQTTHRRNAAQTTRRILESTRKRSTARSSHHHSHKAAQSPVSMRV